MQKNFAPTAQSGVLPAAASPCRVSAQVKTHENSRHMHLAASKVEFMQRKAHTGETNTRPVMACHRIPTNQGVRPPPFFFFFFFKRPEWVPHSRLHTSIQHQKPNVSLILPPTAVHQATSDKKPCYHADLHVLPQPSNRQ